MRPPDRVAPASSGANARNGLVRMLATTMSYCGERNAVGQVEIGAYLIGQCIVAAGNHGLRIHVDADGAARAQLHGGDGEDAGTATVVEHRFAALDVRIQPAQAQARGGMAAGAEGEAGIECDVDGSRDRSGVCQVGTIHRRVR